MFDKDLWQEILYAIKKNRLRTILTAFGVFWGIFMLMIMLGAGKGLENGVSSGFGDFSVNSLFVWGNRTSTPYKGFISGRWVSFDNTDTKALLDNVPEIDLLAPRLEVESWSADGNRTVIYKKKSASFNILGDYPQYNRIDPLNINQGRFINNFDISKSRKVAVIGSRVVEVLFENGEDPMGKYIQIRGMYFKVVGVFKSKHTGGWAQEQEQSIFLPFTTLQRAFNYGDKVHYYSMTAKPSVPVSIVEEKVKSLLKKRHFVHPDDPQAIGSANVEVQFKQMSGLFTAIRLLIWIIGTGTLLAGIIGVSNIMLVIIKERTKEIGIQRAIGASPFVIIRQILAESVFITTIAGYIGLVIGVGIVELVNFILIKTHVNAQMFSRPEINFRIAIISLTILIISGLMAGFIPSKKAISLKPIDALRYE